MILPKYRDWNYLYYRRLNTLGLLLEKKNLSFIKRRIDEYYLPLIYPTLIKVVFLFISRIDKGNSTVNLVGCWKWLRRYLGQYRFHRICVQHEKASKFNVDELLLLPLLP